jgi:hypothetical protein
VARAIGRVDPRVSFQWRTLQRLSSRFFPERHTAAFAPDVEGSGFVDIVEGDLSSKRKKEAHPNSSGPEFYLAGLSFFFLLFFSSSSDGLGKQKE